MTAQAILDAVRSTMSRCPPVDYSKLEKVRKSLEFSYRLTVASENLLRIAALAAQGELREYFEAHLLEEIGHEAWLAEDLEVLEDKVDWAAVTLAGSQYYLINYVHPAALLGYMLVLEGTPIKLTQLVELEKLHGKKLFRTLRYHAEHDIDHAWELMKIIDKSPFQDLIRDNALRTAHCISAVQQEWANA